MHRATEAAVEWREPAFFRYVYDTSDARQVVLAVVDMISDPDIHYVTIHSQARGREDWDAQAYLAPLLSSLKHGN